MQSLEKVSPLAIVGRFFMAALFVGTLWMASAGCWGHDDHDDHWHHDHDMDHHDDLDHR